MATAGWRMRVSREDGTFRGRDFDNFDTYASAVLTALSAVNVIQVELMDLGNGGRCVTSRRTVRPNQILETYDRFDNTFPYSSGKGYTFGRWDRDRAERQQQWIDSDRQASAF